MLQKVIFGATVMLVALMTIIEADDLSDDCAQGRTVWATPCPDGVQHTCDACKCKDEDCRDGDPRKNYEFSCTYCDGN